MREAHDERQSGDESNASSSHWNGLPSTPPIHLPPLEQRIERARRRSALLGVLVGATLTALAAAALWPGAELADTAETRKNALWSVELSAAGTEPVTALVFGKEAGVHIIQVPGAGGAGVERRWIPVHLARGDVYMVSLGRSNLDVAASPAAPGSHTRVGAQARFVSLFQNAEGTGVRGTW